MSLGQTARILNDEELLANVMQFYGIISTECLNHYIILVGEPKSRTRILQNDKKIAPDFDMAEFLYIGSLINT